MHTWKRFLALIFGAALATAGFFPGPARAAVDWQADPTRPLLYNLTGVAYGDGQFVAVGEHGSIITSPDGERWQVRRTGGETENIGGIAYGNGRFVATPGPYAEGDSVLISADGVTWTRQPVTGTSTYTAITFCDGEFWAPVQYPAGLAHSRDGVTWQTETLSKGEALFLNRIACGGGTVVAVTTGNNEPNKAVVTFTKGAGWTRQTLPDVGEMYDVAYGDGRFVIMTYGSAPSFTSTDGKSWTSSGEQHSILTRASYGDGHWTGLSFSGGATSTDGLIWQDRFDDGLSGFGLGGGLVYGGGRFVAVSIKGFTAFSTDGLTWTVPAASASGRYATSLVFSNGLFVALGQGLGHAIGTTMVSVSTDGLTWETQRLAEAGLPQQLFYDYTGQRFAAVVANGDRRSLYTSQDGRTWTGPVTLPDGIISIIEADGQYVAISPTMFYRSHDLVTWDGTAAPAGTPVSLAYNAGTYVLTEREPDPNGGSWHIAGPPERFFLYTSADAREWTRHDVPLGQVIACGGRFAEASGRSSADGVTWTDPVSGGGGWGLTCSNGLAFGTAGGSIITVSNDGGRSWGRLEPALGAETTSVAFGNGRLVAVGAGQVATTLRCGGLLDVANSDPACGAITALKARGVMGGFPGGLMQPEGPVTRAQLAKLLVLTLGAQPDPAGNLPFADTAGHWAAAQGWLQAVRKLGAINGYPDGTFRPDGQVTRAELIKLVAAAAGLPDGSTNGTYSDIPADAWYAPWVRKALAARLIGPDARTPLWAEKALQPNQPVTRGEAAMLLSNLSQR